MNKSHVVIVPCGSTKLTKPATAKHLYQGNYFKLNLKWALSVAPADSVFILSAKHGFVALNTVIDPYDTKMGSAGSIKPSVIAEQAAALGLNNRQLYALGGQLYINALRSAGLKVCAPFEGLGMGWQRHLAKKNMGRLPKWVAR